MSSVQAIAIFVQLCNRTESQPAELTQLISDQSLRWKDRTVEWFALSLVAPLLYAATNHIDKLLLEDFFQDRGIITLILFSSLLSAIALPILYLIDPTALEVGLVSVSQMFIVGALNILVFRV